MHDEISLPMMHCGECDDLTLAFAQWDAGTVVHHCVHCQTVADSIEWVEPWSLVQQGYRLDGVTDPNAKRGCRGGACGVRQPGA